MARLGFFMVVRTHRMVNTWRDNLGIANFHLDPYGEMTLWPRDSGQSPC
jgi:hypothetical protein